MAELLQREQLYTPLWQQIGGNLNLHRWAGFSGALAVIMAAYGAHGHQSKGDKDTFMHGNQMHFFHTLVLLAMPLARRPSLVRVSKLFAHFAQNSNEKKLNFQSGTLFLIGILLFSGGCYFRALTASAALSFVPPIGGVVLIIAWITLMFWLNRMALRILTRY